jgi:putative tryptophan/tyrosine transport system substrate-binding protein
LAQQRVNAVIIGTDPLFTSRRDQLVVLAARHVLPAIHYLREFADAGRRSDGAICPFSATPLG